MRWHDGRVDPDQAAAYDHPDVQALAEQLLDTPTVALLRVAKNAILFGTNRTPPFEASVARGDSDRSEARLARICHARHAKPVGLAGSMSPKVFVVWHPNGR